VQFKLGSTFIKIFVISKRTLVINTQFPKTSTATRRYLVHADINNN